MAKAKTKPSTSTEPVEVQLIQVASLVQSPTNPRKRIKGIAELAASIAKQGVIQPITARVVGGNTQKPKIEIVSGERRWLASREAGLMEVPVILRDLTDEQVLEIQIHENLHREDIAPLDEAIGYKFLQDKFDYPISELALRVGKSEAYVLNRLKINSLIKEIQDALDDGSFPLTYALEIAKFSDPGVQSAIFVKCFDTEWDGKERVPDKTKLRPFRHVKHFIENDVLYQLSKAPFDRKATNLRDDGLACVKCPDRTGANKTLFADDDIGKHDCCLNPGCYADKSERHVELLRTELAADAGVEPEKIPYFHSDRWDENDNPKHGALYFAKGGYEIVEQGTPDSTTAIEIAPGKNYLKPVQIRKKNRGSNTASSSSAEDSEKEQQQARDARLRRKEELFDIKVGEAVRLRVLEAAAVKFAASDHLKNTPTETLRKMVEKFNTLSQSGPDSYTRTKIIEPLAEQWKVDIDLGYRRNTHELSDDILRRLIFLFLYGSDGASYYDRLESRKPVRQIAQTYGIPYCLFDAQERLNAAPMKHKDIFRQHLSVVEADDALGHDDYTRPLPRIHFPKYKHWELDEAPTE